MHMIPIFLNVAIWLHLSFFPKSHPDLLLHQFREIAGIMMDCKKNSCMLVLFLLAWGLAGPGGAVLARDLHFDFFNPLPRRPSQPLVTMPKLADAPVLIMAEPFFFHGPVSAGFADFHRFPLLAALESKFPIASSKSPQKILCCAAFQGHSRD
jgi:hypothetical protein